MICIISGGIRTSEYLESLTIDFTDISTDNDAKVLMLFNILAGSTSLREIILWNIGLEPGFLQDIVARSVNCPHLVRLNIGGPNINAARFREVVQALDGRSVQVLLFDHCNINDITALSVQRLPHLRRLSLEENSIQNVPQLNHACPRLEVLNLFGNMIQMPPPLDGYLHLVSLCLDRNRLGNNACPQIAMELAKESSSLVDLSIQDNDIDENGWKVLTSSLKNNTVLEYLYVHQSGYNAFLELLIDVSSIETTYSSNHALIHVGRSHIELDDDIVSRILKNVCLINRHHDAHRAGVAKIIAVDLKPETNHALCNLQGVDRNGQKFGGISINDSDVRHLTEAIHVISRSQGISANEDENHDLATNIMSLGVVNDFKRKLDNLTDEYDGFIDLLE